MSQLIVPPIKTSRLILFDTKKIRKSESFSEFLDCLTVRRDFNYIGVASKEIVHFPRGKAETKYWLCGKAVSKLLMVINPTYAQNKDLNIEADEIRYVYIVPAVIATEDKCVLIPSLCVITKIYPKERKAVTSVKANFATFADREVRMVELGLDELSKFKHKEGKQDD